MPIKFRCQHCKQFLGISRAQAGKMTDCPTCGRTIRVPHLDGRVEPVQAPKLNLDDSALVSALDALAMIGNGDAVATDSDPDQPVAPRPVQVVTPAAPAPAPRPVILEPPLPAHKVTPSRPAPAPVESFSPDQELARLAAVAPPPAPPRRLFSGPGLIILGFVALLTFGAGFSSGWALKKPATAPAGNPGEPATTAPVAPRHEVITVGSAIQGRITFKSMDGDSLPDKGARIIAFPQEKPGSSLLAIDGFQVTAADTDQRVARAGLRALGGDLAIADEQGNFHLDLASPGTYHLLVISNNQPPETPSVVPSDLETLLGQYFSQTAKYQENLRRVSFEFAEVRYKGQSTQEWNHSFDRL